MMRGWRCLRFFFCMTAFLFLATACVSPPGRESLGTVAKASPYAFGLYSIPGEPILYQPTRVTYFLSVPGDYSADRPRALVLAISPSDTGKDMFAPWEKAARQYGFIFACPNKAGNSVRIDVRGQSVMDTLYDVTQKYAVDPERILLIGFSGGARMSTGAALKFPGLFAGLVAMEGVVYNENYAALAGLKLKRGVYLFNGEKDFNRNEAERAKGILDEAGVPAALMISPGKAHAKPDPDQCLEIYRWFLERKNGPAGK